MLSVRVFHTLKNVNRFFRSFKRLLARHAIFFSINADKKFPNYIIAILVTL